MKNLILKLTFFVTLLMGVQNAYSQEVQLATLQHGDDLQVFYGKEALINAMVAADHGDLITLSAGTFEGTTINKAVKLQGAGYITDVEKERFPTVIGDIYISLESGIEGLVIEGIYSGYIEIKSSIIAFTLKKCRMENISFYGQSKNCTIDQCQIKRNLSPDASAENFYCKNSIIGSIYTYSTTNSSLVIENCLLFDVSDVSIALFRNNIITGICKGNFCANRNGNLSFSSTAYNNIFFNGSGIIGVVVQSANIQSNSNLIFGKEIDTNSYSDTETYELTDDAKTTYLGTDGTQVGIYGGETPFSDIPTNPQITAKSIDAKSSVDGKLKVNITVEAQK